MKNKQLIQDFKEFYKIKRLTNEAIYEIAKKQGYRDLSLFEYSKFAFGNWVDNECSKTVFRSDDKIEAIKFLSKNVLFF